MTLFSAPLAGKDRRVIGMANKLTNTVAAFDLVNFSAFHEMPEITVDGRDANPRTGRFDGPGHRLSGHRFGREFDHPEDGLALRRAAKWGHGLMRMILIKTIRSEPDCRVDKANLK